MPGLCVGEKARLMGTRTQRVCSTALSERRRESLGRLAGGRVGALQAPLFEVLRGEARPLWRRQVRHIVRPPGQLCPELVPVDHCGQDRTSFVAMGPGAPKSLCWRSPPGQADPAMTPH